VRALTDGELIDLYFQRSQTAIEETERQYGTYCLAIAMNILRNKEDAAECVNDTYFNVWNAIPPARPEIFSSFIARITRNLALDKYKSRTTKKRGGNSTTLLLSELTDCIPSTANVEDEVEVNVLAQTIEEFLATVKKEDMAYFVCRYWYSYSVKEVAKKFNVSVGKVKMSLLRTRNKLKIYLEKEDIIL